MRTIRYGLILTAVLLFFSPLVAQPTTQPTSEVRELVNRIQALYDAKADFSAHLAQEVKRAFGRPLKSSGMVYFKKPGKMLWDYKTPQRSRYIFFDSARVEHFAC